MDSPGSLALAFSHALRHEPGRLRDLSADQAWDWRDALLTMVSTQALHTAPLSELDGAEWFQHDPDVARLKGELEVRLLARLDTADGELPRLPDDAVAAMRMIARQDLVPEVYDWLASEATLAELVEFVAIEGGPDGGFDDLVAICQIGLAGIPKVVLGTNYWDEMGRGVPAAVHTELHHQLVGALELPEMAPEDLPVEALERAALNGLLATNRAFQPEMIGALGLLELQAGPRCRRVVAALHRLGAPPDAFPFYEEHATADPRHGKDWLDRGVTSLLATTPQWGARIVRGARWRSDVNRRLFAALRERFRGDMGCAA